LVAIPPKKTAGLNRRALIALNNQILLARTGGR
jgi:hypothetical protein